MQKCISAEVDGAKKMTIVVIMWAEAWLSVYSYAPIYYNCLLCIYIVAGESS